MPRQIQGSQRDFSFGQIETSLKRSDDHPARKAGLRQMANARILSSGAVQNRPGRRAIYPIADGGLRTDRFTIMAGLVFDIQFAPGRLKIINAAGATVADFTTQGNGAALPWATASDINDIVFAVMNLSVTITFGHSMRPQVVTFDGVATWTIADYAETVTVGGQKRTPFYRISEQGVTMSVSATSGAVIVTFSEPIVVAGMVGTRVRYSNRQVLLTSVINSTNMNGSVIEPLPPGQVLTLSSSIGRFTYGDIVLGAASGAKGVVITTPTSQLLNLGAPSIFSLGQAVTGLTSGATGIVTSVGPVMGVSLNTGTVFVGGETISGVPGTQVVVGVSTTTLTVQVLANSSGNAPAFGVETIVSPSAQAVVSAVSTTSPHPITVWDEEVFNTYRGFPASVFTDQFRLGFCDFPSMPGGIGWSAINAPYDLYVGPNPADAMFEIAPAKVRVYHVVPGPESSEFIFTDRRVYYIPISPTNPLKPGSVAFQILSGDGAAQVQPRIAQEAVLYVNAGQSSVMAVIATGAYQRPFNAKNLCDFHASLFNSIQCIAAPSADGTFNDRYVYVLNGDGSIVVGKYDAATLVSQTLPTIGWGPWSGGGVVSWIGAYAADVVFTTAYFGVGICEVLDDTQYLDCALAVNALPTAFAPLPGNGPLWFISNRTVSLIDQVTRSMGVYDIDGFGFIVPQGNGNEDLTRLSLVAGQPWTMTVEPFAPDAQSGADQHQRMMKRRVSNFAAYVVNSTGFVLQKLFSRKETSLTPPLGTPVAIKRVPMWNFGDDATLPPKLRETMESWRPSGHSFDPRVAIVKDTPGPLQIVEIGMEVTL